MNINLPKFLQLNCQKFAPTKVSLYTVMKNPGFHMMDDQCRSRSALLFNTGNESNDMKYQCTN